jgi:hypothetical protein
MLTNTKNSPVEGIERSFPLRVLRSRLRPCCRVAGRSRAVEKRYHRPVVDLNVKNLEPDVVERLAQQAAAEGMSQQEWIRQTLRRSAARLSPAELLARRQDARPMSADEFAAIRRRAATRRRAAVEGLGAQQRRR